MMPNYLYAYDFDVDGFNYKNGTRGGNDQYDWNYDAVSNLWKAVDNGTVPSEFGYYFAAGDDWHSIDYTQATHNGDTYEIMLPNELGKNQWQGQFHIDTKLTASAEKKYEFYLIMEADNNCPQVTFKLTDAGDTNCFVEERNDVVSGEPFILKRSGVTLKEGIDAKAIRLFFDFGGSLGGTNVKISKIYFGETANSNNNSSVFEVDGINYKVGENNVVSVISGSTKYSGNVVIPSQVTYWGTTYSVTSIGNYTFMGCSDLTSVTIPNSVTFIGNQAFENCSSLTTIVSEIEKPFVIDTYVFTSYDADIYTSATLIVPKGTKAAYQATEGWNRFINIVEAGDVESDQPGQIHINDIFYKLTGLGEAEVVSVEEGEKSVTIPSTISYNNNTYKVTSIAKEVFENREHLAAVIWEPEAQFNATVNNPNFLLYVSDEKYASHTVKNVVVNGVAERIELADAANSNDFYCPRAFSAKNISYSHNYQMETGFGDSKGWETIVLPFDVQKYTHATKGELESFTTWSNGSNKKPFWLFDLTASGYKDAAGIKANTPYIISMPNNQQYEQQYQIPGIVTFSASDVEVQKSDNLKPASYQGRTFVPNYTNQNNLDFLALNVSNNYVTNPSKEIAGSKFIRGLRAVHPFEAYMTTTDNTRSIDVMDGMTTAIRGIQMVKDEPSVIKVYDTRGVLLKTATSTDDIRSRLKTGVYIVNGKKLIIK